MTITTIENGGAAFGVHECITCNGIPKGSILEADRMHSVQIDEESARENAVLHDRKFPHHSIYLWFLDVDHPLNYSKVRKLRKFGIHNVRGSRMLMK